MVEVRLYFKHFHSPPDVYTMKYAVEEYIELSNIAKQLKINELDIKMFDELGYWTVQCKSKKQAVELKLSW